MLSSQDASPSGSKKKLIYDQDHRGPLFTDTVATLMLLQTDTIAERHNHDHDAQGIYQDGRSGCRVFTEPVKTSYGLVGSKAGADPAGRREAEGHL